MPRFIVVLVKWLAAAAVLGNLCWLALQFREHLSRSADEEKSPPPPNFVENGRVVLKRSDAQSLGLETEPARTCVWRERVEVFGRVVPNPRATYEIRSPFAGTLRAENGVGWPELGQKVKPGQTLGRVVVRFGPQERLDLLQKLSEARRKLKGAEEIRRVRQAAVDRLTSARSTLVQRDLDEALVQLADAQTQWATVKGTIDLYEQALAEIDGPVVSDTMMRVTGPKPPSNRSDPASVAWSRPLTVPAEAGAALEVTELAGQPGTAVEAGGLIVRLVNFRHALVRLDFPAESLRQGPSPAELDLTPMQAAPVALRGAFNEAEPAKPAASLKGTLVGPAPQVDAGSQLVGYWYAAETEGPASVLWRPGLFVRAPVSLGQTREAVAVPASALLYHQGRALVYVVEPGSDEKAVKFQRREVTVLGHDGDRVILAPSPPDRTFTGLTAGEQVVSKNSQVLLSTEFRPDVDND